MAELPTTLGYVMELMADGIINQKMLTNDTPVRILTRSGKVLDVEFMGVRTLDGVPNLLIAVDENEVVTTVPIIEEKTGE